MKFEVGDKVKIVDDVSNSGNRYKWTLGRTVEIEQISSPDRKYPYYVHLDGRDLWFNEAELVKCCEEIVLPKELFEI
jgi:hypothetical protein